MTHCWGSGVMYELFYKLRPSITCLIQAYTKAIRVHFENSDCIFFPLKILFVLEETSAELLPAATQSLTLHKLTEKE